MRKNALLLAVAACFLGPVSFAQVWVEAGVKANMGPSGYFNSFVANDAQHDYTMNLAFSYGGVLGLNIGDFHGLNLEVLTGTYFQDIIYRPAAGTQLRNSLEWDVLDFLALYRFYPKSGMYLELGPKLTRIQSISQTSGPTVLAIDGIYEDDYISGVAGIGAFLVGSEVMVIKAGLRFEYGVTDFVSEQGVAAGYPSFASGNLMQGQTAPFRVSFGMEMSFGLGGIAQSGCGRRNFVLGGKYR